MSALRILVIGAGGREHAIAWKLAQEASVEIFATPGNPGIAALGTCLKPENPTPEGLAELASHIGAGLTVVGPEAPLAQGVVDAFRARGLPIIGPCRQAAQLESSKLFAKHVMTEAGVPTARYCAASSREEALRRISEFGYPVVLKADGLAAGKGVIIAEDHAQACQAVDSLMANFGPRILIEEFLAGEEASFIVLSDGRKVLPMEACQDHKTVFDDDRGPNTGGMGAYCDGRVLNQEQTRHVMQRIIHPVIDYMQRNGTPFSGFLYAGLKLTGDGPKVLEFNVRLGDPEAQSLLHRLQGGFLDSLKRAAQGDLSGAALQWRSHPSVCVVVAAAGYPGKPRTGDLITGIEEAQATGAVVFHAGTRLGASGLETAGGRVLGVTSSGKDLAAAIENTYAAVSRIHFEGMHYRKDIGRKGLKRW